METIELYRADKTVLEWSLGSTVIIGVFECDHAYLLLGINMPFCEARGVRESGSVAARMVGLHKKVQKGFSVVRWNQMT